MSKEQKSEMLRNAIKTIKEHQNLTREKKERGIRSLTTAYNRLQQKS